MRTENYNKDFLDELLNDKDDGISAKDYIKSYFYKVDNPVSIFMWVPEENKFEIYTDLEIKSRFIPSSKTYYESKVIKKIQNWFFNDLNDSYRTGIKLNDEKTYTIGNQKYINLFEGYNMKFDDETCFSDDVINSLQIILKHIKEIICSDKESDYNYLLNWIGNICNGTKNSTAVYLKSGQGTGKSLFSSFLCEKVFPFVSFTTSDVSLLNPNAFNMAFKGKVIISFEELPTTSKFEWEKMNGILKSYITGKTIDLQEKYKPRIFSPNILNFIINSNVNCIKLESDDRRYFVPDVSNKYVNNRKYFDRLATHVETENVGLAFFIYASKFVKRDKFNPALIPTTINKTDNIVDNLSNVYQFLKDEYLTKKTNIDTKFTDLYDQYTLSFPNKNLSKIEFSKKLSNIKIICKKIKNVNYVKISFSDLLQIFTQNNWIHELDEIDTDGIIKKEKIDNTDYLDLSDISDNLLNVMQGKKIIKKIVPVSQVKDKLETDLEAELDAELKKEETKKIVTKVDHSKLVKKTKFISNKETNPLDFGVKKTNKTIHSDDLDLILNLTD